MSCCPRSCGVSLRSLDPRTDPLGQLIRDLLHVKTAMGVGNYSMSLPPLEYRGREKVELILDVWIGLVGPVGELRGENRDSPRSGTIFFVVARTLVHDWGPIRIPNRRVFFVKIHNSFRLGRECAESRTFRKTKSNYLLQTLI